MRRIIIALCVATLAIGSTGSTIVAAQAAPVQHQTFRSYGDYAYFNGHKGYRKWHQGWRWYNGFWFPPAAFIIGGIFGAILGDVILNHR